MHTIVQAWTFPITQTETNYTTLKTNIHEVQVWEVTSGCNLESSMAWKLSNKDAINKICNQCECVLKDLDAQTKETHMHSN